MSASSTPLAPAPLLPPAPQPEPLLHLELRRLREVRLHEHDFMLYNGGRADFKDRVGEKHGVRGAERGLSQRHQDGDCQVKSVPIAQRTAMCALRNFWKQVPRACWVARRDYSTLYPLFQL